MLAHLHRHDASHAMEVVGSGNSDGINLVAHLGEHFTEITELGGIRETLRHRIKHVGINIAKPDNLSTTLGGIQGIATSFSAHSDTSDLDFGVQILPADKGGHSKGAAAEERRFFEKLTAVGE